MTNQEIKSNTSHWPITLTNGITALFMVFLPLALVRLTTPDQMGRYSVFFLYFLICPSLFMVSGLTNGLYYWAGKYPSTKPEVRQSWTLLLGVGLTLCAIGLAFAPRLAALLKLTVLDVRILLLNAPLGLASKFMEDLLIARGDIWKGSFYSSGLNIVRAATILAAAWLTHNMQAVFWSFLAWNAVRTLIGLFLLHKTDEILLNFSWEKTKNVLRYAMPVSIACAAILALENIDQIILSMRLSPAKFAFYAAGCLSIPPLQIFETSVNRVMIPRLSQAFSEENRSKAASLFSEGVSELFCFLLPATLGLMIYSRPIVQILFTDRYISAANILRFFALTYLFTSIPYDAVARSRGDGRWIMRVSILFAIFSISATWLAAGRWNAMGALIATLACHLCMRLYSLTYARHALRTPYSEFLPLQTILPQCGLAAIAAACSILARPFFANPKTWFMVTGPLFTLLYFGGVYLVSLRRYRTAPGPVRILELAQTLSLGGLERVVCSLASALQQRTHFKVLVATYDHPKDRPSLAPGLREAGVPVVQWQKGNGFSFRSVYRLVQLIFSEKIHILHAHDLGPLIYGSMAKFLMLGQVRLFFTLHTLLDIRQNRRYRLYYQFFLKFPDRIIAVSPGVRNGLLALGVSPERIELIPNGVSFSSAPSHGKERSENLALRKRLIPNLSQNLYSARWLLCLARIHPGKGQDVILDVWRTLPETVRSQLGLFLVGQETHAGYMESLRQRIRELPDSDRIVMVGPSAHPQDWMQHADVFVSGSLHEGMPLAPLEAAGSGLPILLTDIDGHRFLEPWAHYFNPQNPEEGAKQISQILQDLQNEGDAVFFKKRWDIASTLRNQWNSHAMTNRYAEIFQTNEQFQVQYDGKELMRA